MPRDGIDAMSCSEVTLLKIFSFLDWDGKEEKKGRRGDGGRKREEKKIR